MIVHRIDLADLLIKLQISELKILNVNPLLNTPPISKLIWVTMGNCGLWVLNEIIQKNNLKNLKNIVGAVSELPAKWNSQSSPN